MANIYEGNNEGVKREGFTLVEGRLCWTGNPCNEFNGRGMREKRITYCAKFDTLECRKICSYAHETMQKILVRDMQELAGVSQ